MTRRTDIATTQEWETYQAQRRTRWAQSTSGVAPRGRGGLISLPTAGPTGPLTLTIPYPPTVNHSTMPNGNGGRYLTDDHRAFRSAVAWIVKARAVKPMLGRLSVAIELFPANRGDGDIDNRIKAVLDALQKAGVFPNDRAVDRLTVERHAPAREAWAVVSVAIL